MIMGRDSDWIQLTSLIWLSLTILTNAFSERPLIKGNIEMILKTAGFVFFPYFQTYCGRLMDHFMGNLINNGIFTLKKGSSQYGILSPIQPIQSPVHTVDTIARKKMG